MTASAAPTPPPVNHKRIARNMASNLLSAIIPVIVTFVTVPVYLHHVGAARYGMVMIAWSLIGYFGFMDLGLSRATTNALARIAHHDEVDPKIRVFWSSLIINACLGTIGALLMYGVGYYLIGHVVKVVDDVRLEMLHALPFVSAMLPVSLVLGVGVGTNEAHERFGILNILQTTGSLLGQAGPLVAVLIWGPSLMIIMPTLLVIRVATCSAILAQAMRTAKIPFTPVVDFALLKQLLSFGGWVTVTNLISPIMTDVDQFVIGSLRNVAVVPFYSVPLNMISRVQILPMTLTRTLFPSFSRLGAKDAQDLLRSTTMYLCVVTTVVYLIATFLAQPFLQLWLGADMAAKGGPVMRIFCFGGWANSLGILYYSSLQGQGKPRLVATAHMCEVIPYVIALYLLVNAFGIEGAAIAWTMRMAADATILGWFAGGDRRSLAVVLFSAAVLAGAFVLAQWVVSGWVMGIGTAALMVIAFLVASNIINDSVRDLIAMARTKLRRQPA